MRKVIRNAAAVVTVNTDGMNYKRGLKMNDTSILYDHSVVIENGKIADLLPQNSSVRADEIIDASGKTVLPGFVESHTHLVFDGSRANEFLMKLGGSTYEDIARAGGGIMNTVREVRKSSVDDLVKISSVRLEKFIAQGVTTIEIKSGYGLDFDNEIKILKAARQLAQQYPVDIITSFLGAHTYPAEYKNNKQEYLRIILEEMIPYVGQNKLAEFCDGFCESTAFTPSEIEEVFNAAKKFGLGLKLHTDQFNSIGGIDVALKLKADSVEHLEVLPESYFKRLGSSDLVCTVLPGVSFFLNYGFAPARGLIDNNAIVAIASDYNPGSSNISNIFLVMSLAAIKMKMTLPEIITAYTINAAKSLRISHETGSLEPGKKADFAIIDTPDYSDIIYNIGENLNYMTIKNGNIIWKKKES